MYMYSTRCRTTVFVVQNFREIAENPMNENFVIKISFSVNTLLHCSTHADNRCHPAHNCTWLGVGLVQHMLV